MEHEEFIIDLKGGLGNQLFQVAFGFFLKQWHRDAAVRFNISYFQRDSRHGGVLAHAVIAGLETIYVNLGHQPAAAARIDVSEQPGTYHGWFISLTPPAHVSGYFQNWKYVEPILSTLREQSHIRRTQLPDAHLNNLLTNQAVHAIGVHIRRGDYLSQNVRGYIGIVELGSILSQVERIITAQASQGKSCIALVVSDMPPEKLGELKLSCECIHVNFGCGNKTQEDILQFALLSRCQSIVCSNSTFSYWASLLGDSPTLANTYLPHKWMLRGNVTSQTILAPGMQLYPNTLS